MGDSIIEFLNTWSPLDLVLIAQNFDRFLYGALVTLQLTVISNLPDLLRARPVRMDP
jgi:hypothetical protein